MKKRTVTTIIAIVAACMVSSSAADRVVKLRAVSATADFSTTEVFAHSPGSKKPGTKIAAKGYLNHEFDPVAVEAASLVFTSQADPGGAADAKSLIAEVKIPDKAKSGILLFLPGINKGPGSALLIEDDRKSFPPGSILVVNHTGFDVRLEIEGKNFDVKAGAVLAIADQPVGDGNASMVKGFIKNGASWEMFHSGRWTHPGGKRVIQTVCENTQTGRPEMKGLKDISGPP